MKFRRLTIILASLAFALLLAAYLIPCTRHLLFLDLFDGKRAILPAGLNCDLPKDSDQLVACAQWRATLAAESAARWAFWQMVIGLAGAVGLMVTLFLNQRALTLAFKTSQDTEHSLSLAREELRQSQDTAQRQLRAYLAVRKGELSALTSGEKMVVRADVVNNGATPAYRVHVTSMIHLVDDINQEVELRGESYGPIEINPSQSIKIGAWIKLNDNSISSIYAGSKILLYTGLIEYKDAFDVERKSHFRYFLHDSELNEPEMKLSYHNIGNQSD